MRRAVNILFYIMCGLLVLLYVFILWTAKAPRVCLEYKLYYIDKELQDWPGYHNLQYRLGEKESFVLTDDNRTKRRGNSWNSFEKDGCWTYGEHASLFFTDIMEDKILFQVSVADIRKGANATVSIAGNEIGIINEAKVYQFEISNELLQDNLLKIDFFINNYGAINEDDRKQGIKIREIVLYDAVK